VNNTVQRALVESINQIGHVMGIRTIAESVEDLPTLEVLRQIGVNYAQGYGLSMPEPLI
jgi:Amt family ammonium transporter